MKELSINIITNNNQYGLSNDASLLVNSLRQISSSQKRFTFKVRPVNFYCSECGHADINFFLELPNPLLIHSGKINILIPNDEWFFKDWLVYLNQFDEIWCKTKLALTNFTDLIANSNLNMNTQVKYISWTSLDRHSLKYQKKYDEYLHVAGKSILKGTQHLINCWRPEYPTLHIIYNRENHQFQIPEDTTNITCQTQRLSDEDLVKNMNTYGIHICPSEAEGFGHYLNEARSCSSVVLATGADPMSSFTTEVGRIKVKETIEMGKTLGIRQIFCETHLEKVIKTITDYSTSQLQEVGRQARQNYINDNKTFRSLLAEQVNNQLDKLSKKQYLEKIPLEIKQNIQDLPKISLVTLTKNRPDFFNLALMNYKGTDYPDHLLEWIIVDDGDPEQRVGDLIPKDLENVKYITLDKSTPIGEKRNIGVKNSSHEIIMMMDDDDIYPPRHALVKLSYLNHYKADCGYCTTIGCFHIKKLISTINVPPIEIAPHQRVSEATLCFKKSFWEKKPFADQDQQEEASYFLSDRMDQCVNYPWRSVLISLLHSRNTSNRVKNVGDEPNGCHFGLSDELFSYLTNIE